MLHLGLVSPLLLCFVIMMLMMITGCLVRQLAQLRQQQQQQTNQATVLSQLTAALNASPSHGAVSAATVGTAPLQMLPQGTVIIQPPATSVAAAATVTRAGVVPQPQVVLINSAALQPQLIVPTGQVSQQWL